MAHTKLIVRKEQINRRGLCTIFVLFTHESRNTYFSTKERIEPRFWDPIKCRVKKTHPGCSLLNEYLFKFKNEIDQVKLKLKLQGIEPTTTAVRLHYLGQQPEKKPQKGFHECREEFLHYKENVQKVAPSTFRHIKSFFVRLREFESRRGKKLTFEKIDSDFYDELLCYFTDHCRFSPNMIGSQIKFLKNFLGWAEKKGYHQNKVYRDFRRPTFASEIIYLTQTELDRFFAHDFSSTPRLERARDLFILGCTTGLRYSDFSKIGPQNIVGDFLILRVNKTGEPLKIPISEYSKKIIEKYEGNLPTLSNQRLNRYLKEAAKIAGLGELREVTTMKGGQKVTMRKSLHELICSHTCRRTFISLSLEKGMTLKDVAAISGHKGQSIQRYISTSEKRLTDQINQHWKINHNEDHL